MKLLFDENLPPRLVDAFEDEFPGSRHVRDVGLERADDDAVWDYAAAHDFTIVSKDSDFHQRSFLYGDPPKVVWLRCGNCTTDRLEMTLASNRGKLLEFASDPHGSFLVLE